MATNEIASFCIDNTFGQMAFLCSPKWAKAGFCVMLKYFEIKKAFRYSIKQIDSMLPCICSVINHRRRQNVVRTSVTHFLFLPHFDVICDLLLNRYTATGNLFVKLIVRSPGVCAC